MYGVRPLAASCLATLVVAASTLIWSADAQAACSFFAALDKDINQPGQTTLITWDPKKKMESFTVKPKFEGNATDFGMVVPTPSQPKLKEAPKEIFKDLAIYTVLEPTPCRRKLSVRRSRAKGAGSTPKPSKLRVTVLESGTVGTLDYKIIKAEDADDLFTWLKENNYSFSGGKDVLEFYVKKKWFFTVMKIDPKQMTRDASGNYQGEITPTRFRFKSNELIYPLKITSISVKSTTEALFYVLSPKKIHIKGGKLEYAKRLKARDIARLSKGKVAVPQSRWAKHQVQTYDFKNLRGWLKKGMYLTKVRRTYSKSEMTDDLRIRPAGNNTEYTSYEDCGAPP